MDEAMAMRMLPLIYQSPTGKAITGIKAHCRILLGLQQIFFWMVVCLCAPAEALNPHISRYLYRLQNCSRC